MRKRYFTVLLFNALWLTGWLGEKTGEEITSQIVELNDQHVKARLQVVRQGLATMLYIAAKAIRIMAPHLLEELVVARMPFGKYKDQLLVDLPMYYLEWYYGRGFPAGKLGMLLHTIYEIKLNGLEKLLVPLRKAAR